MKMSKRMRWLEKRTVAERNIWRHSQCMYNVTLIRVRATIVAVEKQ